MEPTQNHKVALTSQTLVQLGTIRSVSDFRSDAAAVVDCLHWLEQGFHDIDVGRKIFIADENGKREELAIKPFSGSPIDQPDTVTHNLGLRITLLGRIEKLRARAGATDFSELIRDGVEFKSRLLNAAISGKHIIVADADGTETERVLWPAADKPKPRKALNWLFGMYQKTA